MSKILPTVVGAVIVAGAAVTGMAWYTGTQVEPLLRQQVSETNQQIQASLAGQPVTAKVELTGFERHVFSSTAHFVNTIQAQDFNGGQPLRVEATAQIEHGPLPWSRVRVFKWLPVMAAMDYELAPGAELGQLLSLPEGQAPITVYSVIGYGRTLDSEFHAVPFKWQSGQGILSFTGLEGTGKGTTDGKKNEVDARIASFTYTSADPDAPVSIELKNVKLHTGGIKGESGFYLGNTSMETERMSVGSGGESVLEVGALAASGSLEELEGKLKGFVDYRFGSATAAGEAVGSGQMRWVFDNLDIQASRDLARFYQEVVAPQAAQATQEHRPLHLQLTPEQQAAWQASLQRLLQGKPHVELQPLGLKTASGESHFSLALDFTAPANPNAPAQEVFENSLSRLDARLSLAKGTLRDLAMLKARLEGQTDAATLAQNGDAAATLITAFATLQGLGMPEDDALVSTLRYENGSVDFNGRKMAPQEFARYLMAAFGQR
jgi:uncharacterized protein YdgA (DUF945 family)